ncbi:MAG: ABC transporter substrate-binding protein, partial [Thermoleophilia bacterium]|nr:ABC transporter substrate-binding protein [Thermoleophilia bacterium]
ADAGTLISMVSKAAFDKNGLDWMKANPVGTGPFVFVSYAQDANATFEKNPNYWATDEEGNKLPYLDGVEFKFGSTLQNRQQMVLSGEVDLALSIEPGAGAADLAAQGYNMVVVKDVNNELYFDTTSQGSPWTKKEVREAAEYAIDKEALAKGLGFGFADALYQIAPSSTSAFDPDFAGARKYDTEKAKQILAAAGYPNGFETTIVLSPVGVNPDIATAVQGYWSAVGIKAQIEKPDMGRFMGYCYPGTFTQGGVVIMGQPAADPSFIAGFNFMLTMVGASWERTPQFSTLLKAATSTPTIEPEKVRAVTDYLSAEAMVLPVMESGSGNCMQTYVMNADGGRGAFNVMSFEKIWFNK